MMSCLSVRYFLENSRTLESWKLSSRAKTESKLRACDIQAGVLANAASGEFEDSGNPAKNRAVSSAVAVAEPRVGAAPSVSMNVTKTAPINLDKDKHTFRLSFVFALYPTPIRNCREALYGDFETAVGLSAIAVSEGRVFDVKAAGFDLRDRKST